MLMIINGVKHYLPPKGQPDPLQDSFWRTSFNQNSSILLRTLKNQVRLESTQRTWLWIYCWEGSQGYRYL